MNSVVFDMNTECGDIQLSNGRVICQYCGYVKYHTESSGDISSGYHYSCLCLLFESAVVCCSKGYSNLIRYIPSIALYSPLPQCTTQDHLNGLSGGIVRISKKKFEELTENAIQAKIEALSNYPYLRSKFLPIMFVNETETFV